MSRHIARSVSGPTAKLVVMGEGCNNKCDYCTCMKDVPSKSYEQLANEVKGREPEERQIIFAGKEPAIHPRFIDLVSEARRSEYFVIEVVTNGRIFASMGFARRAVKAGLTDVLVGLFSADPKLHDELTKVPGSWKQTVAGIKNLLGLHEEMPPFFRPAVVVGVYLGKKNHEGLGGTLAFLEKLGVKEIFIVNAGFSDSKYVEKHAAKVRAKVFTVGFDTPLSYEKFSKDERVIRLSR